MTEVDRLLTDRSRSPYRFVCYGSGDGAVVERFAAHSVGVDTRSLPEGGPRPFVVVEEDGEFRGRSLSRTSRRSSNHPSIAWKRMEDVSSGYNVLFQLLDDAVFTGMTRRELLAVSREIEERAFRIGTGTLRVGFQTLSKLESQTDVYRTLGAEPDLDVHVYGAPDWTPPTIAGVTYHEYPDDALERYWLLAYDSETATAETCALVARETDDAYDSFWTSDPGTTRAVLAELERP